MKTLPLVKRFQMSRWSAVRKAIHNMPISMCSYFPPKHYFNVKASIERLNDAYEGTRLWWFKTHNRGASVFRAK